MLIITVFTCRLGSVHRPNLPLNSWTPMTANMKRRRMATTKMFPMFFTEATMHCTTCFRPAALLIALGIRNMRVVLIQTTKSDLSGLRTRMTLRTFTTDTAPELRKEIATQCVIKPTWERMQHGWPQPRVGQEDLLHFCKSFPRAESVHLRLFSAPVRLWRLWWRNSQNSWEPEIFVI